MDVLVYTTPALVGRVLFQIGEAPYFGQFGHFTRYAPVKLDYAVTR